MGSTSALQSRGRPWTKAGAVAVGAHGFYELAAGAAMPYASLAGPLPVAAIYGAGSYGAFRAAGRRPESEDLAFSVLNGLFLSLVLAHFASWPRTSAAGLPWLTESEGIRG